MNAFLRKRVFEWRLHGTAYSVRLSIAMLLLKYKSVSGYDWSVLWLANSVTRWNSRGTHDACANCEWRLRSASVVNCHNVVCKSLVTSSSLTFSKYLSWLRKHRNIFLIIEHKISCVKYNVINITISFSLGLKPILLCDTEYYLMLKLTVKVTFDIYDIIFYTRYYVLNYLKNICMSS